MKWYRDEIGMVLLNANDIIMNYSMWINTLSYDEVGIAPIPRAPNGKSISELFVYFKGILATTTDPMVRDAAWKYVRFAGSDEARNLAVDIYVENNFGKFIMPELLIKYGYEDYVDEVPEEWAETVRYSFENSVPEPYGKNSQFIYPLMSQAVSRALQEDLVLIPDREYRLKKLQSYYDEAVEIANEKMMEIIPENEAQTRKIVSFIVATIIFILFVFLFIYIWRVFTPKNLDIRVHQSHIKKYRFAYLLLMPAILAVLIFNYYPLVRGAVMAFQEYNVIGGSEFIGMKNFNLVFFDKHFWFSILVAVYYAVLFISMVFLPPIFLAILLAEIPVGNVFFRIVYYLPAVISGIVMMLMWKNFFNSSDQGLLNQMIGMLGLEPIRWLGNKNTAMISIMLPQAWAGIGPGCLIYLAALKTVPDDLYESVSIDGGGFFHRIRYVTLPIIKPLILIQLIFALIAAFQAAETVLVMTGGGPNNATMVVGLEIFFNAYMYQRFGVATSMAWILGFILMGFTVFQMRRLSKLTFTTAKDN
jgi:multiple sugar transport system permease protein